MSISKKDVWQFIDTILEYFVIFYWGSICFSFFLNKKTLFSIVIYAIMSLLLVISIFCITSIESAIKVTRLVETWICSAVSSYLFKNNNKISAMVIFICGLIIYTALTIYHDYKYRIKEK